MGWALGAVKFERDGVVMFCGYNGTADVMGEDLFLTRAEFRGSPSTRRCKCEGEAVEVACWYGGGSHWQGKACREHRSFKGPFGYGMADPYTGEYDVEEKDGVPEWAEKAAALRRA